MADTCPISPYPKWLGVVVKRKNIALSDAEYLIAVMTAFPLSLVATLLRGLFPINAEVSSFSLNCSYPILTLFLGVPWDVENRIVLGRIFRPFGLPLHVLGNAYPQRGPWALMQSGPGSQIL